MLIKQAGHKYNRLVEKGELNNCMVSRDYQPAFCLITPPL